MYYTLYRGKKKTDWTFSLKTDRSAEYNIVQSKYFNVRCSNASAWRGERAQNSKLKRKPYYARMIVIIYYIIIILLYLHYIFYTVWHECENKIRARRCGSSVDGNNSYFRILYSILQYIQRYNILYYIGIQAPESVVQWARFAGTRYIYIYITCCSAPNTM